MGRLERSPITQQETILEKAGKVLLKILAIGALAGISLVAIKSARPVLDKYINKLKGFIKS